MNRIELKKAIKEALLERGFVVADDAAHWKNSYGSRFMRKGDVLVFNCPHPCGIISVSRNGEVVLSQPVVSGNTEEAFIKVIGTLNAIGV